MAILDQPDETPRRAGWLTLLALATALLLAVAATMVPHDPYIRVQQLASTIHFRSVWGYERIVFDRTPIDVAVIGNSRLGAGISAPMLEADLSNRLGRPVHVANFSLAQDGSNSHYAITRLLLEHHPEVKLLLLVAIEQMPREGHPAFRNLADAGDIARAPVVLNRNYLDDLAYLPYRQLSLAVQSWHPGWFGLRPAFDPAHYAGAEYDTTLSYRQPDGTLVDRSRVPGAAAIETQARHRREDITPPLLPFAAGAEFAVPRTYIRRMADLARANGTRVAFLYLPIFGDHGGVRDAAYYRPLGPILNAGFLANDAGNYSDYVHLNRPNGVARLDPWLAATIVDDHLLPAGR